MLESRWRAVVATRPGAIALRDAATGAVWTFAELVAAADREPAPDATRPVFPVGDGPGFILTVLRAWRSGAVVCPLETGQPAPALPLPPPDIAHLKLTSGTTGDAKCVALTAAQLAADADAIVGTMGLEPGSPNLGAISLAHSYGFSNLVLPLLLHGIPLVLAASPLPAAVVAAARLAGGAPLTLPAVPAMWRAWHGADAIPTGVRLAISAGAALPLSLEEDVFARRGLKIHNFLGASECGGIAYDRTDTPRPDPALVGTALDGVRLHCEPGGQLCVTGPAVAESYWPESRESLAGGRYRTGDLVELTTEGSLFLRGRSGDVINVAGRKVTPERIEEELRRHPAVRECLVLGLPAGDARGETVAAIVAGSPATGVAELRDFLLARLPAWQVPKVWRLEDSLSPDRRGKLSRAGWRARLQADPGSGTRPA